MGDYARAPRVAPRQEAAQVTKKAAEIEQLRTLMRAGTLLQAVAQAAIKKAEEELRTLERIQPAKEENHLARIIRMLPRAADALRERIGRGNLGLRDPRSIMQGRNVLFSMFGGKVPLRPGTSKPGRTISITTDRMGLSTVRLRTSASWQNPETLQGSVGSGGAHR